AIEWCICVAECLSKMTESPGIACIESVLSYGELFSVRVKAVPVGSNVGDRSYLPNVFAAEIASIASMAFRAVFDVQLLSSRKFLLIDRKGILRRFLVQQPFLYASDLL